MSTWIDFKDLRRRLSFETVLQHYGVTINRKGDQHHGLCPLPNHGSKNDTPSFSANLPRGVFQCFGCKGRGNVLDFAVLMEREQIGDGKALRRVALKLIKALSIPMADRPRKDRNGERGQQPATGVAVAEEAGGDSADETDRKGGLPVVVNGRLDFELKGLDPGHPFFGDSGLRIETVSHFGLGFCERGLLKDRIAIPLHDHEGALVGYAGMLADEGKVNDENPRFRFPGKRERNGKLHEFRKSLLLYNAQRIGTPCDDLIVTEGFESVWWLHQNGHPRAVAVMGSDCSAKQAELIVSAVAPTGRVWALSDAGEYGRRFAMSVLVQVSPYRAVRWARLAEDTKPWRLPSETLKAALAT